MSVVARGWGPGVEYRDYEVVWIVPNIISSISLCSIICMKRVARTILSLLELRGSPGMACQLGYWFDLCLFC